MITKAYPELQAQSQVLAPSCQNPLTGGAFPNNNFCSEQVTHMTLELMLMREATWAPSAQKNVARQ